ncbi:MAG TPA: M48 family metallopeptidase [Gammaproteobacteria bacterium]|nr:M48 family metallopeptidase [Gammaproteobacteria bacterium]
MNAFTAFFLVMVALSALLQLWLASRQVRHISARRNQVPEAFRNTIPLAAHQKAADYSVARTRLGMIELGYGVVLLLLWTLGGGLNLLDDLWRQMALGPLSTGVAVMVSALLIMGALDLPVSIYHTFVLETRFGFNRTTPGTFIADTLKGGLLMVLIGAPLAWLVLWLMAGAGALWWLYVWAVWMGFTLLMMWAYPAFIAPLFNRFTPLQDEALESRIRALLHKCGFRSQGIYVVDGSRRSGHGNAYFTGLGNNKRIVFFDTLLKSLDPPEIEAVLAHELGHFRLKHIHKRMLSLGGFSLVGLLVLAWLMQQTWFYTGLGVDHSSTYMALLLFMLTAPTFTIVLQPVFSWLSRKHEFEADSYAATQADSADLVRALVKLYRENASTLTPDPLYSAFHDSHPPAPVRVAHLSGIHRPTSREVSP